MATTQWVSRSRVLFWPWICVWPPLRVLETLRRIWFAQNPCQPKRATGGTTHFITNVLPLYTVFNLHTHSLLSLSWLWPASFPLLVLQNYLGVVPKWASYNVRNRVFGDIQRRVFYRWMVSKWAAASPESSRTWSASTKQRRWFTGHTRLLQALLRCDLEICGLSKSAKEVKSPEGDRHEKLTRKTKKSIKGAWFNSLDVELKWCT